METIALFGCGGFARNHVGELVKRDDVEIGYLIDPSDERRKEIVDLLTEAGKPIPATFSSPEEFLAASPEFDAADIVTPPEDHYKIARRIIEVGKPVYVEKPFTQTSDQARELTRLAEEKGVQVEIGTNRRVFTAYRAAAIALGNNEIGDLKGVSTYTRFDWENRSQNNWRLDPNEPGSGALFDHGSHNLYYLRTDLGFKPIALRHLGTRFGESGVDVDICFQLRDQQGRVATLIMDDSAPDDRRVEIIRIEGDNGLITIEFNGKTSVAYIEKEGSKAPIDTTAAIEEIRMLGIGDEMIRSHPALVHNFVDLINGKTQLNANPAREGILPAKIIEAVETSRGPGREDTLTKAELDNLGQVVIDGGELNNELLESFYSHGTEVALGKKDPELNELSEPGMFPRN